MALATSDVPPVLLLSLATNPSTAMPKPMSNTGSCQLIVLLLASHDCRNVMPANAQPTNVVLQLPTLNLLVSSTMLPPLLSGVMFRFFDLRFQVGDHGKLL